MTYRRAKPSINKYEKARYWFMTSHTRVSLGQEYFDVNVNFAIMLVKLGLI